MELIGASVREAAGGRVRLVGDVVYDDRPGQVEQFWFDVSERYSESLSRSGNPWLVCLAPLSASLGEPLRIDLPVDALLYRNLREVSAIWKTWYPRLHEVKVTADVADPLPTAAGSKTGAFFSGGVDSFFTVLRNRPGEDGSLPIDDLICVGGFDIPLRNPGAFAALKDRLSAAAADLGTTLVDVTTNLRETRLEEVDWRALRYGGAVASAGLALEGRYGMLLIASSYEYASLEPLGSHPLTDPLFSTTATRVIHDGAAFDRFQKVELVSRSEIAMRSLHVCFRAGSDRNCGNCEKCLRTMVMLEISGHLADCGTFPRRTLDLDAVSRILVPTAEDEIFYESIRRRAAERGRSDLVRAVNRCLRRSRVVRGVTAAAHGLDGRRLAWRAGRWLRHRAMSGAIR